jgi:hypothetical protein
MRNVHGRARIIGLSGVVESPGALVREGRSWSAVTV